MIHQVALYNGRVISFACGGDAKGRAHHVRGRRHNRADGANPFRR